MITILVPDTKEIRRKLNDADIVRCVEIIGDTVDEQNMHNTKNKEQTTRK